MHLPKDMFSKVQVMETVYNPALETIWQITLLIGGGVFMGINFWLDTFGVWFIKHYHLNGHWPQLGGKWATDFVSPPGKDVDASFKHAQYGPHPLENVDVLRSTLDNSNKTGHKTLIYLHGGGWMAANSAVLLHSVAPFARSGYTVYSANYPLAPETRFPGPLLSTLRLLQWLKLHEGIDELYMLGDSAGGNLVTMGAALVSNSQLYLEFANAILEDSGEDIQAWVFPQIIAVASAYGIMCQGEGWRQNLATVGWLENMAGHFIFSFAMRMYKSEQNVFGNKFTISDIADRLNFMPPTFLFCGDKDHLSLSNQVCYEVLQRKGHEVTYNVYPGRHAFFGLPPAWLGKDAINESSLRALDECLAYFKKTRASQR